MRKLWILISVLIIAGCGEDTTTPTVTPFALNLIITDTAGERLPGVEARVHVQIPELNPSLSKAVTKIPFGTPVDCDVVITAFNMEGQMIKKLAAAGTPAGAHLWVAPINLDDEPSGGTGYYRYEMVATDGGTELYRESRIMTIYESFDYFKQPALGVTDTEGRISFGDKTRLPFLYDLGLQPNLDENGLVIGEFEFSDLVAITLTDTLSGDRRVVDALVESELNIITLVWADQVPFSVGAGVLENRNTVTELVSSKALPPAEFFLGQNYPNPFN